MPILEVRDSNDTEKYNSYRKDNTEESRVHRSFAVEYESQVKCEHAVGKMQTFFMLNDQPRCLVVRVSDY